jgi:hypothetical protein
VQSDKGVSSVRLAEAIGISQPTAWRMGHALRLMVGLDRQLEWANSAEGFNDRVRRTVNGVFHLIFVRGTPTSTSTKSGSSSRSASSQAKQPARHAKAGKSNGHCGHGSRRPGRSRLPSGPLSGDKCGARQTEASASSQLWLSLGYKGVRGLANKY